MDTLFLTIRAIHVLCGALWIGQVVVINALLLPLLPRLQDESRKELLVKLFPKIYSMASHLSLTVLITGIFLVYYVTQGNLGMLFLGRWGLSILVGGSLGIFLSLFQFYLKRRIAVGITLLQQSATEAGSRDPLRLGALPRFDMLLVLTVFLLMLNAVRGIF